MIISDSLWRKSLVTAVAAAGFVSLYEVTALDSRYAARQAALREATADPSPGARLVFSATAYCKGVTTASGAGVHRGVAASDPTLLPTGSVVDVDAGDERYDGIYTVMDTGPAVQGRELDLYMWSCHEALAFGRRQVKVTVLRLGWNPAATAPTVLETLFKKSGNG
jgi:3D (Asp-Asp-Asp) domain-containing protein